MMINICVVIFMMLVTPVFIGNAYAQNEEEDAIGVYNEWGRLREVVLGIEDDTIEPEYVNSLVWVPDKGVEYLKEYGGKSSREIFPQEMAAVKAQIDALAAALEKEGVKVNRLKPMRYQEEKDFLSGLQKGNMLFGGADFFRVIDDNVILLNSFRLPFRRKQVWAVRPVLEPIIKNKPVKYFATPPPSPHYLEDDIYLENGDIAIDGSNVYVGISGNASSEKGVEWLRQLLGPRYKVWVIRLKPDRFHLDWVLGLNRPGLLTYCPDAIIGELPEPLRSWDKIVVNADEVAGANNLVIDENTIVVPEQYKRIADEYKKRGMRVVLLPFDATIKYGSGPRCLAGVLRRDH
jgi:N-dimethylarginine dimethylaminohydrolase